MQQTIGKMCLLMSAIAIGFVGQAQAYCAKCVKIEDDREKEQAAHPMPWNYYDDITNVHSDRPVADNGKPAQNIKKYSADNGDNKYNKDNEEDEANINPSSSSLPSQAGKK